MQNRNEENKYQISLDRLKGEVFGDGFATVFCDRFLPKVVEFSSAYKEALLNYDTTTLSEIVHTMTSSLRFLGLDEFVDLINRYRMVEFRDSTALHKLANEVEAFCRALELRLKEQLFDQ